MAKKALYVRALTNTKWDQALYKLNPPIEDASGCRFLYVVASAAETSDGPETLLFPASADGEHLQNSLDGEHLQNSLEERAEGVLDHAAALRAAGYEIEAKPRWDSLASRNVERPDIDAFLTDLDEVCRRHGLSISHEDGHGSFIIERYDASLTKWLAAASVGASLSE